MMVEFFDGVRIHQLYEINDSSKAMKISSVLVCNSTTFSSIRHVEILLYKIQTNLINYNKIEGSLWKRYASASNDFSHKSYE